MTYPSLNEQIKEFGVWELYGNCLRKNRFIQCKEDYSHDIVVLHHYIKEQEYYRYPERYKGKQKLILLPIQIHNDVHSAMSDARFYQKWHIQKSTLLYRQKEVNK